MLKKIFYVILHYQAEAITINCIDSILRLDYEPEISVEIVIVDNHSPNKSGELILEKFKDMRNIHVILAEKNMGFAKGNNLGFKYAKQNGADFIVQMNNDMVIEDQSFNKSIISIYNREKYGILGPNIFCPNENIYQNPTQGFSFTVHEVNKKLVKARFLKTLNKINLYDFFKSKLVRRISAHNNDNVEITKDNCKLLHGSCLIFSPIYISCNDGINPNTFMYYEENILAYECLLKHCKMYFSNELTVLHFRKIATQSVMKNKEKNDFFYIHSINSLKILKDLIVKKGELI